MKKRLIPTIAVLGLTLLFLFLAVFRPDFTLDKRSAAEKEKDEYEFNLDKCRMFGYRNLTYEMIQFCEKNKENL